MKNILFLCTGNSCRSQMAEGWSRKIHGEDVFKFHSAGTKKSALNPWAVRVMKEEGVDITAQFSKTTAELPNATMDVVFTVCSDAHENCPVFPGGKIIHVGFDDPPRLTEGMSEENEILPVYRRVRDEIKGFVERLEEYTG